MTEKTIADVALKFNTRCALEKQVKKCSGKGSCGELLPITDFKSRRRGRVDGTYRIEVDRLCHECKSKFQALKDKNKHDKVEDTELKIVTRMYFCELRPVAMGIEIREERRALS